MLLWGKDDPEFLKSLTNLWGNAVEEEQIKPCPFCGQIPDVTDPDFCYPLNQKHKVWQAGCIESAGGCGAFILGSSAEEAINKWNTRAK